MTYQRQHLSTQTMTPDTLPGGPQLLDSSGVLSSGLCGQDGWLCHLHVLCVGTGTARCPPGTWEQEGEHRQGGKTDLESGRSRPFLQRVIPEGSQEMLLHFPSWSSVRMDPSRSVSDTDPVLLCVMFYGEFWKLQVWFHSWLVGGRQCV